MRPKVAGEENFTPELFERARQLVWHYGLFSIVNPRAQELKEFWFAENGEDAGYVPGDVRPTRILVLAGRSLHMGVHTCNDTCAGLPTDLPVQKKGYQCQYCDRPFDPISTRYLCPYEDCKMKNTCCEG